MYPNLKLKLWTSGIRQNRLAKMLNLDETTLSRIVNGFREPNEEIRGRIATLLESDEGWLFSVTGENTDAHNSAAVPAEGKRE
jgi:transcriptional regulator with XRE-family HTH domain